MHIQMVSLQMKKTATTSQSQGRFPVDVSKSTDEAAAYNFFELNFPHHKNSIYIFKLFPWRFSTDNTTLLETFSRQVWKFKDFAYVIWLLKNSHNIITSWELESQLPEWNLTLLLHMLSCVEVLCSK